eukprot:IDg17354t1
MEMYSCAKGSAGTASSCSAVRIVSYDLQRGNALFFYAERFPTTGTAGACWSFVTEEHIVWKDRKIVVYYNKHVVYGNGQWYLTTGEGNASPTTHSSTM